MKSPRTPETEAKYQAFKTKKHSDGASLNEFNLADEVVVREFRDWLIIENRFPYDAMTSINHMLVPREQLADFYNAARQVQDEYHEIRRLLTAEAYYDAIVENFPRSQSVTRHAHSHLVRWKYTNEDGSNLANN